MRNNWESYLFNYIAVINQDKRMDIQRSKISKTKLKMSE